MQVLILVLGMSLPGDDDRIEELVSRVSFRQVETRTPEERTVYATLSRADLWRDAFRSVEKQVGRFPDGLSIEADFEYEGAELAKAAGKGAHGRIRFNLKRLALHRRQMDENDRKRIELEKTGRTLVYKVPPIRIERVIHHEMVHVRQQGYTAPDWFNEGLAVLVGDDPNPLYAFVHAGKEVGLLDLLPNEGLDGYARGHLFWKWLSHQGWAEKTVQLTVVARNDWQTALQAVSGFSWSELVFLEREWSASEALRIQRRIGK